MIAYIVGGSMRGARVSVWRRVRTEAEAAVWITTTYAKLVEEDRTRTGLLTYGVLRPADEEYTEPASV